ncbi:MAG: DEAD/DEAH box helicase [Clostridia bacterium]|nr:DEAD/DEAH box helicase [Clostridia bacterium]
MRYDGDAGKILISTEELVEIAQRRISVATDDYDTAEVCRMSDRLLSPLLVGKSIDAALDFSLGEHCFLLLSKTDGSCDGGIVIARMCDFRRGKTESRALSKIRGIAFISAYAFASKTGLDKVNVRVIAIDKVSGERYDNTEVVSVAVLLRFFEKCSLALSLYARPEIDRVTGRLPSMRNMKFPFGKVREGQEEFMSAAYRAISRHTTLIAQAPTGTGKTVAALYPALRALGNERCGKVFYLTPKTTTAEAARDTLNEMARCGACIRGVILPAKERVCTRGGLCRGGRDKCALAPCTALAEAVLDLYSRGITVVTLADLQDVSLKHAVCPHELALTYSELCDVVICDINYVFDPAVHIRRYFDEGGSFAILVDEAHNLPDRAREMFSAEISGDIILSVTENPLLPEFSELLGAIFTAKEAYDRVFLPLVREEIRTDAEGNKLGAYHSSSLPTELFSITEALLDECDKAIKRTLSAKDDERDDRLILLRDYTMKIKRFYSALSRFDSSYEMLLYYNNGNITAKLFCIDTGAALAEVTGKCRGVVYFSATLVPLEYYRATLGADRTAELLEVASPFNSEALSVSVIDKISTRYSERERTLPAVCRTIAATISVRRGNYMVFAPSFEYLEAISKAFIAKYPKLKVLVQRRDMTAAQKAEFIAEFKNNRSSYLVGFCVMGGIYSEGIDLSGDSLIGAVVVGIGMPALSYEREAIAAYFGEKYEMGKEYAYVYPGINRVLQAAGRVIRTEDDRGVIVLIDDRFDDPLWRKSTPRLWRGLKYIGDAKTLVKEIEDFWQSVEEENK